MRYSVFFSPTGGVKRCLSIVNRSDSEIDLAEKDFQQEISFSESDVVFIALPSFGGRCPELAIKRLSSFKGNGAKAIIMAVYGNRAYEDTLIELYDKVRELGFKVSAALTAIAEHSMVSEIAKGRPDRDDIETLEGFKVEIESAIESGSVVSFVPGNRPYKALGKFLVPITEDNCIRCAKCFNSCPANAIDELRPNLTDSAKCIGCARCIHLCPVKARDYDKESKEAITKRLNALAKERKEAELYI